MFSLTGLSPSLALFPAGSANMKLCNSSSVPKYTYSTSCNPGLTAVLACNVKSGLGSSPFARHYLGNLFWFLFLGVLRCFNSPGLAFAAYLFNGKYYGFAHSRLSDSVISGSKDACSYPKLIAACHDLHRLLVPRHPPYALIRLTILFSLLLTSLTSLTYLNLRRIIIRLYKLINISSIINLLIFFSLLDFL